MYVNYVYKQFGKPTIVFDGYSCEPSTKDATHYRRTGGRRGPDVHFQEQTLLCCKKDNFLKNKENKQKFIHMLSSKLEKAGSTIIHAKSDADTLIVKSAIDSAQACPTVVIGDDTDLLVLLIYHVNQNSRDVFFKPQPKSNSTKCRIWDI